jgi:hypothetical protein
MAEMNSQVVEDNASFRQGKVPAAKQHGETALLGSSIDSPCPGPVHSLRIGGDDEAFVFQGIEAVDHSFIDHRVTVSGREPVLQPETRDVLEISGVMGYEGQVVNESHRGDQEVNRRDFDAAPPELNPDLAKLVGAISAIFQEADLFGQQLVNTLQKPCRIRTLVCPNQQLRKYHR